MKVRILTLLVASIFFCQANGQAPKDWFHLDPAEDGYNGVSSNLTYKNLLKGKKSATVVVAVIDSGVDYDHEDLKNVMWVNTDEIPDNGIDDDKNGYIDDIHGWNFIGGKDGQNIGPDTYEVTRLYAKYKKKYEGKSASSLSGKEKEKFDYYLSLKKEVEDKRKSAEKNYNKYKEEAEIISSGMDALKKALGSKPLNAESVAALNSASDEMLSIGINIYNTYTMQMGAPESIEEMESTILEQFQGGLDYYGNQFKYSYNPEYNPRNIVGDNYNDPNDRYYGNNDYEGPDAFHGTHVAGIIAAEKGNNIGIDGVADNVRIMTIRAVPDGDERDKDVANAIRYAVDNGASVINMSFGKGHSWTKELVDDAVKYAKKNDVLLVHAAGNSSLNTDVENNFPNDKYAKRGLFAPKRAKNWLEVGALSHKAGESAVASFSNYGKANVDIFAPGTEIYSTVPDNKYKNAQGTSMASPVVAGVAAMIRSYYPALDAIQVKEILLKSSIPVNTKVLKPGSEELVPFSELCTSGGMINAYRAIQLASKTKGNKKVKRTAIP